MFNKKGFTFIELMVIISIIAFLTTIGIVAFTAARDKARVAKGLQFSQSINNAYGSEAVGIWGFDQGLGTTVLDGSGQGNNGTLMGGTAWSCSNNDEANTPSNKGCSLYFDGLDDYVKVPTSPSLDNVTDAVTVGAWVKINSYGTNQYRGMVVKQSPLITSGCKVGYGFTSSWGNGKSVWFAVQTQGASDCGNWVESGVTLALGQWYYVVGTYNSVTGKQKIYIDGILKGTRSLTPGTKIMASTGTVLEIGKNGSWFSNSSIDDVRIYSQALESAQIKNSYLAGLNNLYKKNLISWIEYKSRLGKI